jgi:hypothetical protein
LVEPGFGPVDTEVAATVEAAAEALKSLGLVVEPVRIPAFEHDFALDVFNRLHVMEMKPAFMEATTGQSDANIYKMAKTMLSLPDTSMKDFIEAEQAVERLRDGYAQYFKKYDALITPVLPIPAHKHGVTEFTINGQTVDATISRMLPCRLISPAYPELPCGSVQIKSDYRLLFRLLAAGWQNQLSCSLMIDITEQKLEDMRKNDFINMVSHELKTPLTSLFGIIQLLRDKLQDNSDAFIAGASDKVIVQVKRMTNLINGFLNISRLENRKIQIVKNEFNLVELIAASIEEACSISPSYKIRYKGVTEAMVLADKDKIGSVIPDSLKLLTPRFQSSDFQYFCLKDC